jgi:metal-responsive CopG/Arc/MetJ family transcriptional regulator
MKTIAISIDEKTLTALDRLQTSGRMNRSAVVRRALREHLDQLSRAERETKERAIFARNRKLLERQAAALVAEQATL